MKRLTIKEIAQNLNLSIGTVSKALNDSYEISDKTKKLVLDYVASINYVPNILAKNLITGKSNIIAVIVPFISSSFFFEIYEAISQKFMRTSYKLILLQTFNDEQRETEALELCIRNNIDGIIISPVRNQSNLELMKGIQQKYCPIIIFDRVNHDLDTYKIGVHNCDVVHQSTQLLINKGKKNIVLLLCKNIGDNENRIAGYKTALEFYGMEINPQNIVEISYGSPLDDISEELIEKLSPLLKQKNPIDAILSTTDTLSLKILYTLHQLNVEIPEQVAVMGFSNTPFAESLNPPLTTINQPTEEISARVFELMMDAVNHPKAHQEQQYDKILLNCKVNFRKSSG